MAAAPHVSPPIHAPNAALLIDFDNVTMGIRSDLGKELRSLLSSEIIKGKVAVQRAYADWRRYPQYIVPLSEASIDLIFAPAYGSSKKNATDIRLAIDALELVFTRPEIGTFILLSGDSDFSSLVIKLKEYGKYVIGVGIRESSSDLLVQNCDEYYSYNALAGLVKASEEDEAAHKYDPWELVTEAVQRMKRNNDVMRSDRLKQVMQEIDSTFDEKNLGISKFSRFCQEAAQRGLLSVTKLDNGQLEIDLPANAPVTETVVNRPLPATTSTVATPAVTESAAAPEERGPRRGRRGRGGRGRDREERGPREPREPRDEAAASDASAEAIAEIPSASEPETQLEVATEARVEPREPRAEPRVERAAPTAPTALATSSATDDIGVGGERLTRAEAFDLVRRTVNDLVQGEDSVRAGDVRTRARQLLGRDSESLSDRMFVRILKDAHDEGIVDLRRRGDDFEVARAIEVASVADQLAKREAAAVAASAPAASTTPQPRLGMGPRGGGARGAIGRGRPTGPPPAELLSIGVVGDASTASPTATSTQPPAPRAPEPTPTTDNGSAPAAKRGRSARGKSGAKTGTSRGEAAGAAASPAAAKAKRGRGSASGGGGAAAKKSAPRARAKKGAAVKDE